MAKKATGHSKDDIKKTEPEYKAICTNKDCKADYITRATWYNNGDVVISPPRCPSCQTAHIVGVRVDKIQEQMKLLGNLKTRVATSYGQDGLEAIKTDISIAFETLLDRLSGNVKTEATKFNLRKLVKA
jgi:hypothetical protein